MSPLALVFFAVVVLVLVAVIWYQVVALKNDAVLFAALDRLAEGPSDLAAEAALLGVITGRFFTMNGERVAMAVAVNVLHRRAESIQIQALFVQYLKSAPHSAGAIESAYQQTLLLLSMYGAAPVKQFCLQMARWHYARRRNGVLTIYDEQAIHNDLTTFQSADRPESGPMSLQELIADEVQERENGDAAKTNRTVIIIAAVLIACIACYVGLNSFTASRKTAEGAPVPVEVKTEPRDAPSRIVSIEEKQRRLMSVSSSPWSIVDFLMREGESQLRAKGISDSQEQILDAIIDVYPPDTQVPLEQFFATYIQLRCASWSDTRARAEMKRTLREGGDLTELAGKRYKSP